MFENTDDKFVRLKINWIPSYKNFPFSEVAAII